MLESPGRMTLTHSAIGLVAIATLGVGVFIGLTGPPVAAHTPALAGLALGAAIVAFVRRTAFVDERRRCDAACLRIGLRWRCWSSARSMPWWLRRQSDRTRPGRGRRIRAVTFGHWEALRPGWPACMPLARPTRRWAAQSAPSCGRSRGCPSRRRCSATAWSQHVCRTRRAAACTATGHLALAHAVAAHAPPYTVAAGITIVLAETFAHRYWQVIPVALVPLLIAYRGYHGSMSRFEDAYRRREVADTWCKAWRSSTAMERSRCGTTRSSGSLELPSRARHRQRPRRGRARPQAYGTAAHGGRGARGPDPAIDPSPHPPGRLGLARGRGPRRPRRRRRHAALARHHGFGAGGRDTQAQRAAAGAGRRRRQRRVMGVGPADPAVLLLGSLAGHGRPLRRRRHRPSRGLAEPRPSRRRAVAQGSRSRRSCPARRPSCRTSIGSATRTARTAGSFVAARPRAARTIAPCGLPGR